MEETSRLLPSSQQDVEPRYVERRNYKYYLIWIWRFFIFALVGSSSVKVTRQLLSIAHLTSKKYFINGDLRIIILNMSFQIRWQLVLLCYLLFRRTCSLYYYDNFSG